MTKPSFGAGWIASLALLTGMAAPFGTAIASPSTSAEKAGNAYILKAARVFDGYTLHQNYAVLIGEKKIAALGPLESINKKGVRVIDLGDATLLPGFIESHAHLTYQNVNPEVVLRHGITTVRDVGGPLLKPTGGVGKLRLLSSGPIVQAPGGYPLNVFGGGGGYDKIGIEASNPDAAREIVRQLVQGGATHIKVALESGGEPGAPWMMAHGDNPVPAWSPANPWPILSAETVGAIVDEAHLYGKKVTAHVGENLGAERSLNATANGNPVHVDEWSHSPCAAIDDAWLQQAVALGVKVVSTIDTLSSCVSNGMGIHSNTHRLAHLMADASLNVNGSEFIYGSEIAHDNVPWGINGEEMHWLFHLTSSHPPGFADVLKVFQSATSKAGENIGINRLGTLTPSAPADVIAVKGNPFERFKLLEYPDLVISGGRMVVNNFEESDRR